MNLIVSEIPPRYDLKKEVGKIVQAANNQFSNILYDDVIKIVELNDFNRHDFTRHGLHYSKLGKMKLAKCIRKIILESFL